MTLWQPATETCATELFEVRLEADFWFHGSFGEQAHVSDGAEDGIACLKIARP